MYLITKRRFILTTRNILRHNNIIIIIAYSGFKTLPGLMPTCSCGAIVH